jgi:diguanylate cyclase (GGDEF)-like protein
MGHIRVKTLLGIAFLGIWLLLAAWVRPVVASLLISPQEFGLTTTILLLTFTIPVFFIWLGLGLSFGLPVILFTFLYLLVSFHAAVRYLPLFFLFVPGYIGYRMNRYYEEETRSRTMAREKIEEDSNLLSDRMRTKENDAYRMRNSLKRLTYLKNIIEEYSLTLSEGDIIDSIARNTLDFYKNANRVLLYLVDTRRQELALVSSKKRDASHAAKMKKGDVFDRWVLKHRIPLVVEDILKDFRFSPEKELDKRFRSVICAPLTTEHKILGLLRADSVSTNAFSQSDLRLLDIIADLSAVSLQNTILYKKVEDLAIHDSLTGLFVQKYFRERLQDEVKMALRNGMPLSLLLLDLDHFKTYNDTYGHQAGDLILRHISAILRSFAKKGDIVARYGGEEFTLLVPNKDKSNATKLAEEIRATIEKTPLSLRRQKTGITVSIGVATCPREATSLEEMVMLADTRLYRAKETGRNRVWST